MSLGLGVRRLALERRPALAGYRHTAPVHAGNDAGSQLQLGGFGDLIETLAGYVEAGHILSVETGERLADVVDLLSRLWRVEDSGLWRSPTPTTPLRIAARARATRRRSPQSTMSNFS